MVSADTDTGTSRIESVVSTDKFLHRAQQGVCRTRVTIFEEIQRQNSRT